MKVFLTSGSGYVGAEVARLLLAEGHAVAALARSDKSAAALEARGIQVVRGSLTDLDALARGARAADAVIHTAYVHEFSETFTYRDAVDIDVAAIGALAEGLAGGGSSKVLVTTSGSGYIGDTGNVDATEEYPFDYQSPAASRTLSERATLLAGGRGVRGIVLRLPPYVWGQGGSYFIPVQIAAAQKAGFAPYALPGDQQLPSGHVTDVAKLFVLAAKDGTPGLYNVATSSAHTIKEIAEAVGRNVGVPARGLEKAEIFKQGFWPAWVAAMITENQRLCCQKAITKLGWGPFEPVTMLEDVATGSYKQK